MDVRGTPKASQPADFSPARRNQVIIDTAFKVRDDRLWIPTRTILNLRKGSVVSKAVSDQRHRIVEETGGDDLTNFSRSARGAVFSQNF